MTTDGDEDEFYAWARREVFPLIEDSTLSVSLMPSTGVPDPKLCLELGASLLFDKPLILVVLGNSFPVPERLLRLADACVRIEEGESLAGGPGAERLQAAITDVLGRA